MILALQTTTFGAYGGIPTYNRVVCRVLNDFTTVLEKRVLIVTDGDGDLPMSSAELPGISLRAFAGQRRALIGEVLRLATTRKIELVLIGHVNYAPLGYLLKCLQPRLRYGVMVHGVDVWSRLPWMKRYALRRADFVVSVSQYTKERMVQANGNKHERVWLLPNALEWNEDATAVSVPKKDRNFNMLSVCRLDKSERYKGVDTVIAALPSIVRDVPQAEFFVVGNGNDLERHKALATKCGVADRVHFLGAVDENTLRSHYQTCDVFVMPSAGEGFGIVFLEAMRYGKPVIAAASGAAPEVIENGRTGILIDYDNCQQLSRAVVQLSSDVHLRETLGRAGFERLQNNFTFCHFNSRLTEILNRELPEHNSVAPRSRETVSGVKSSL